MTMCSSNTSMEALGDRPMSDTWDVQWLADDQADDPRACISDGERVTAWSGLVVAAGLALIQKPIHL